MTVVIFAGGVAVGGILTATVFGALAGCTARWTTVLDGGGLPAVDRITCRGGVTFDGFVTSGGVAAGLGIWAGARGSASKRK